MRSNQKQKRIEFQVTKYCIWCGEWLPESEWKSSHPLECPYFTSAVSLMKGHIDILNKREEK